MNLTASDSEALLMYGIESGKLPQQPSLMRAPDVQTPTWPGHAHARSRQKQKIDVATVPIPLRILFVRSRW